MVLLNLAKRLLPFFLTFTLGLFIASFFVTLSTPQIRYKRNREHSSNYKYNNHEYNKSCWNSKKHQERAFRQQDFNESTFDDAQLRDGEINFDAVAPAAPDAPTVPRKERR